jgi:hypothetical protein
MKPAQPDPEALRRCLEGIEYRVGWQPASWATEIGSHMRHGLRRQAAAWYARKHFNEHGRLPEGTHHVRCRCPGDIDIGCHSSEWSPVFETHITYPPADPR